METSSPLAAMQRPPVPTFGGSRDVYGARLSMQAPRMGGLNLREQFRSTDYFSLKHVNGSSPAGSLAMDLCQNFRIGDDSSPAIPTPRRSLFSAHHMGASSDLHDYVTTPPLPASSPMVVDDAMDISPLPVKKRLAEIEVHSPTPVTSPEDDDMVSPTASRQMFLEPPKFVVADRRKIGLRRPSLTRTKGYSTSAMTARLGDSQLPYFRFGADSRPGLAPSAMSLSDCFADSPPQDRRPQTANSPSGPPAALGRPKVHFSSLSSATAGRAGPPSVSSNHNRRLSNPLGRPRRNYRRSLSMFEGPGDVMKPKPDCAAPAPIAAMIPSLEEASQPILPHFFPEGQNDSIPRINRATFLELMDGRYDSQLDQKIVIDCRFEYEYEGGHISEAVSYNDKDQLAGLLFGQPMAGKTLLVFHCEYSAHRAPLMARHIRAEDRTANVEHYPRLTYPDVYILEGGYSAFFAENPERCFPQAYVGMNAAEHAFTCEREMGRLRQTRKGLSRAQTFAFGQQEQSVQDSPTSTGRMLSHESPSAMISASPILGTDRCHARRMASY